MQLFNGLSWIHDFSDSNSLPAKKIMSLDSVREIGYNTVLLLLGITKQNMWLESSSQKDQYTRKKMIRMIATKTSKIYTGFMVIAHVPLLPANTHIHTIDQEGGCVFLYCTDEEMSSEKWRYLLQSVTKSYSSLIFLTHVLII